MRNLEIIAAFFAAAIVFIALKLLGLVLKFAVIAALLGFAAGLVIARLFRRSG